MKYIRTEDGIKKVFKKLKDEFYLVKISKYKYYHYYPDCKTADTIEELCDAFVFHSIDIRKFTVFLMPLPLQKNAEINVDYEQFGAIWTDKGLIFVAKMNEKGEWELI